MQLSSALFLCIRIEFTDDGAENLQLKDGKQVLLLFIFLVVIIFFIFVLPLVFMHTYLVLVNLTTWEMLSWKKITYLKIWPRKLGSPFSHGLKKNLYIFF